MMLHSDTYMFRRKIVCANTTE